MSWIFCDFWENQFILAKQNNKTMNATDPLSSVLHAVLTAQAVGRPVAICIAGSNGAGKSTFFAHTLKPRLDFPFVNADEIAKTFLGPIDDAQSLRAAVIASNHRNQCVKNRQSFIFETVFSDAKGEKVSFLRAMQDSGYLVLLVFIGIPSSNVSQARVIGRVVQGGHDVPDDRIKNRFPQTSNNLRRAIAQIENILLLDNNRADNPFAPVALIENGKPSWRIADPLPTWAQHLGL